MLDLFWLLCWWDTADLERSQNQLWTDKFNSGSNRWRHWNYQGQESNATRSVSLDWRPYVSTMTMVRNQQNQQIHELMKGNEICAAVVVRNGNWTDELCNAQYPFFCYGSTNDISVISELEWGISGITFRPELSYTWVKRPWRWHSSCFWSHFCIWQTTQLKVWYP